MLREWGIADDRIEELVASGAVSRPAEGSLAAELAHRPGATLVCFHAHPDDEAIATGGSMARADAEGHRVVLVVATDGAHGEVPDDLGRR